MVNPRLALLLSIALAAPALAQTPSPPAADRQWLVGTWKLDRSFLPDADRNWNRPNGTSTRAGATTGDGRPADARHDPDFDNILSLSTFGQTLIAASETLELRVEPDAIRLRDDFREPMRYETTGRKQTMVVSARLVNPNGSSGKRAGAFTASVQTSWNGNAVVQEIWTRDLLEIVRVTRTFIPADNGRQMLLVIKVLDPKLKDPVKDIERVYVRQSS